MQIMDEGQQTKFAAEPPSFPGGGNSHVVGDPIDVVTGANTDIRVDFRLHRPLPLRWRRFYNSAGNTVAGAFGWGHTHRFDQTLTYDLDRVRYTDPFGKRTVFPTLGIGLTAANSGVVLRRSTAANRG